MRYAIIIPLITFTCFSLMGQSHDSQYKFIFTKIDNQAIITVNDSIVFDSGGFDYNPELDLAFNITEFLSSGNNEITVKLINFNESDCYQNPWAIAYEFFKDLDPIDYQEEDSDGFRDCGGVKFQHTYFINR